ncbi:MAG: cytochrome c-type biogenesis protein CcmH [Pseudomonadota bacterium]
MAIVFLAQSTTITLSDADEARAEDLMREIRCVACENEPISQSASDIAETMRVRVRELVADGATDQEVRTWFADRYGEFVLFRPQPRKSYDWLLWLLPFTLLIGGVVSGYFLLNRRSSADPAIESVPPEHFDG